MKLTIQDLPQAVEHLVELDWQDEPSGDVGLNLINALPLFALVVEDERYSPETRQAAQRLRELIIAIPGIDLVQGLPERFDARKHHRLLFNFGRAFESRRAGKPNDVRSRTERLQAEGPQLIEVLRAGLQPAGRHVASVKQETEPATGEGRQLSPAIMRAYSQYKDAIEKHPNLASASDREVYEFIKRRLREADEPPMPPFESFARYLRIARSKYSEQKNALRRGRQGRSVVPKKQL